MGPFRSKKDSFAEFHSRSCGTLISGLFQVLLLGQKALLWVVRTPYRTKTPHIAKVVSLPAKVNELNE